MEKRRVSVRTLVETVMLSGSLSATASSARLLDGIRGHQALQAIAEEGARNEVSVSGTVCSAHIELTVYGRIDRLYGENRVEEIKTTYLETEHLHGGDPQHWAQAKCYAYLFCKKNNIAQIDVRLTYFHLGTGVLVRRGGRPLRPDHLRLHGGEKYRFRNPSRGRSRRRGTDRRLQRFPGCRSKQGFLLRRKLWEDWKIKSAS